MIWEDAGGHLSISSLLGKRYLGLRQVVTLLVARLRQGCLYLILLRITPAQTVRLPGNKPLSQAGPLAQGQVHSQESGQGLLCCDLTSLVWGSLLSCPVRSCLERWGGETGCNQAWGADLGTVGVFHWGEQHSLM